MAAPSPKLSRKLILQFSDYWLNVAVFQGERLAKLLEQQSEDADSWTREQWRAFNEANLLGRDHMVETAESYFFIVAVARVLRWLDLAKAAAPAVEGAIDAFLPAAAHVIDVRDMHEHEEEYLAGGGWKKERYLHEGGVWTGSDAPSAHTVVVSGDSEYWIGGRVNLSSLLAALRTLLPEIYRARAAVQGDDA